MTVINSASEMTYIVSSGALNSTHYYYDCYYRVSGHYLFTAGRNSRHCDFSAADLMISYCLSQCNFCPDFCVYSGT